MEIYLVVFDGESTALSGKLFPDVRAYVDGHYVEAALREEYDVGQRRRFFKSHAGETGQNRERTVERNRDIRGGEKKHGRIFKRKLEREDELDSEEEEMFDRSSESEDNSLPQGRMAPAAFFAAPAAAAPPGLDDLIRQNTGTFEEYLQQLINRKGMTNADVYKRANLSKQYFSKIMHGQVKPAKEKLLCIAIALKLNLDETTDFLKIAGFALSPCSKTDLVFEYFITRSNFDIFSIDIALFDCGLPSLMD